MENEAPAKKTSKFKIFLLLVLGFIALSFILQLTGLKVMDIKKTDTVIERPHQNKE